MKDELITEVMQQMLSYLDNSQLKLLRQAMEQTLYHYDVTIAEAKSDEDYVIKSPVRRIHKVKAASRIKETYSDEDLEKMRDNSENLRDLAIIDMLASTGMHVGEIVLLNRDDINFAERECVVFGKGDKERIVYFDARAKLHLQEYLNSRLDDNPALFVTLRAPHERIQIGRKWFFLKYYKKKDILEDLLAQR